MAIQAALMGRMMCCSITSILWSTCEVTGGEILSNSTKPLNSRRTLSSKPCRRLCSLMGSRDEENLEPGSDTLERFATCGVSDAFICLARAPQLSVGFFTLQAVLSPACSDRK